MEITSVCQRCVPPRSILIVKHYWLKYLTWWEWYSSKTDALCKYYTSNTKRFDMQPSNMCQLYMHLMWADLHYYTSQRNDFRISSELHVRLMQRDHITYKPGGPTHTKQNELNWICNIGMNMEIHMDVYWTRMYVYICTYVKMCRITPYIQVTWICLLDVISQNNTRMHLAFL